MADAVEEGFFVKAMLENVYGMSRNDLRMAVITDSLSLERAVKSTSQTKDRRTAIDLAVLREGQDKAEYSVVWQPGVDMLADPLSKAGPSKDELREVLKTGYCGVLFEKK